MRTSAALFYSSPLSKTSIPESAAVHETFPPPATTQRSPWHSPVPYLFGGLAAMLGMIAFALLILACSYWRLISRRDNGGGGDGDAAEKEDGGLDTEAPATFEEKLLVIMAGDVKPTFLATPTSTANSYFNHEKIYSSEKNEENEKQLSQGPIQA